MTSACHIPVELDPIAQHLVRLLDGTRTHEEIARELAGIEGAPAWKRSGGTCPAAWNGWPMALLEG